MARTERAARQLPLLPASDMSPADDPVGVALGIVDNDSDRQWSLSMYLFARMGVRAYHQARAEAGDLPG